MNRKEKVRSERRRLEPWTTTTGWRKRPWQCRVNMHRWLYGAGPIEDGSRRHCKACGWVQSYVDTMQMDVDYWRGVSMGGNE